MHTDIIVKKSFRIRWELRLVGKPSVSNEVAISWYIFNWHQMTRMHKLPMQTMASRAADLYTGSGVIKTISSLNQISLFSKRTKQCFEFYITFVFDRCLSNLTVVLQILLQNRNFPNENLMKWARACPPNPWSLSISSSDMRIPTKHYGDWRCPGVEWNGP